MNHLSIVTQSNLVDHYHLLPQSLSLLWSRFYLRYGGKYGFHLLNLDSNIHPLCSSPNYIFTWMANGNHSSISKCCYLYPKYHLALVFGSSSILKISPIGIQS
uniref:Uncharacterized protein n=1 Tax=Chaetoceros debilis TaxID=122233 RepID=A0A7S3PWT4_9STRA